jgi:hypothetical protein
MPGGRARPPGGRHPRRHAVGPRLARDGHAPSAAGSGAPPAHAVMPHPSVPSTPCGAPPLPASCPPARVPPRSPTRSRARGSHATTEALRVASAGIHRKRADPACRRCRTPRRARGPDHRQPPARERCRRAAQCAGAPRERSDVSGLGGRVSRRARHSEHGGSPRAPGHAGHR